MSNRLERIASLVHNGVGVADVGTDHAYLPVLLLKRGYTGHIIATDINEGPIAKARANLSEHGLENKVELIRCDGLDGCSPDRIDTIIIAGMGGDTITGILDRAEWCSRPDIKLILQPVTKCEILRYWLINNGFAITDELLTEENGVLYQILRAEPGEAHGHTDAELFTGCFDLIEHDPLSFKLLDSLIKRFSSAVLGLERNKRGGLDAWLEINRTILNELIDMRERK